MLSSEVSAILRLLWLRVEVCGGLEVHDAAAASGADTDAAPPALYPCPCASGFQGRVVVVMQFWSLGRLDVQTQQYK